MLTKRLLMFLIGCIGSRSALALITKIINPIYLPSIGYIGIAIAIGFFYVYFIGSSKADAQLEWAGDKKIWWDKLRAVHGLNYLIFGILAINKNEHSWKILALDVIIGLGAWLIHHGFDINFD